MSHVSASALFPLGMKNSSSTPHNPADRAGYPKPAAVTTNLIGRPIKLVLTAVREFLQLRTIWLAHTVPRQLPLGKLDVLAAPSAGDRAIKHVVLARRESRSIPWASCSGASAGGPEKELCLDLSRCLYEACSSLHIVARQQHILSCLVQSCLAQSFFLPSLKNTPNTH